MIEQNQQSFNKPLVQNSLFTSTNQAFNDVSAGSQSIQTSKLKGTSKNKNSDNENTLAGASTQYPFANESINTTRQFQSGGNTRPESFNSPMQT